MSKRSRNRTIDHPIGKGKAVEMASWTAGSIKCQAQYSWAQVRKQSARYNNLCVCGVWVGDWG